MSVELHEDGKILVINLTGKLTKDDYQRFIPEIERLIKKHSKMRMLVQMHDFHGWTAGALLLHLHRDSSRARQLLSRGSDWQKPNNRGRVTHGGSEKIR
jgi:hypothetical protein